ncbi:MAG: zinc-binding dehydrogenase [Gemmatimonadales bacterium]
MKALALDGVGGLEHLALHDLPRPELEAGGDALIRVHAAALNRLDLFVTDGLAGVDYRFPHIVGSDGAGVVEAVGSAVTGIRAGDRVMINPGIACGRCAACLAGEESLCATFRVVGEHRSGTAAEYVVVPAVNLAAAPPAMSWAQAAAFSLATLTAWHMLATRAALQPGETVLVWGIGGGVALAALQVARHLGARVIVTSGSDAKLEAARRLGADATVNHATQDVVAEVRRLTDRRGADVVVDSVGQARWQDSLRAMRRGGRLVICGATTGPMIQLDLRRLFWHQWSILGATLGGRREYAAIVALAHEGLLWPVVDSVVPLECATEAFGRLQRGEQTGKLVIEVAT